MRVVRSSQLEESFFISFPQDDQATVRDVLESVRREGDRALVRHSAEFDGVALDGVRVGSEEIERAAAALAGPLASALDLASDNLRAFAERQLEQLRDFEAEIRPGVRCGQRVVPIERIGVYVPAGRHPLFSSLLMAAVPARVAGVSEIAVCSPPVAAGSVHPLILAAAGRLGLGEVFRVGGIQAIGALAFGTESVRRVDKIVGPGNRYVAMAKKAVFGAVGVDLIAGPSEILIVADETADPGLVAADLLAQAEHDADAEAVLITNSERLAARVLGEVNSRLPALATCAVAEASLRGKGLIVLVDDLDEAVAVSNRKAPEHLELHVKEADVWARRFLHYGSVFVGPGATEALADYTAGINHTLPTAGSARFASGLSVRDFLKVQTTLRVDDKGLAEIGRAARLMAEAEGLAGHAASLAARIGR